MKFSRSVFELIARRKSVRTYSGEPVSAATLLEIRDFLGRMPGSPFGSRVRFSAVAAAEDDAGALKKLGTYGVIRRPAGFIIGAVADTTAGLVDFGHGMETAVLFLEDLGLGSCWLGGSFRKSRFAERIGAAGTECVPAVLSFGVPAPKPRTFERIMRAAGGSDSRKPFESLFFDAGFDRPMNRETPGPIGRALDSVRLAPSASNRQPWRVVRDAASGALHFYLARDRAYSRQLKWFGALDLQKVDLGIAASHFEWSARESGLEGTWSDADPRIDFQPPGVEYLFSWIPRNLR
jgi:nitroreductase